MSEATESEGGPFDASDEASDRFDGSVGDADTVPVDAQGVLANQGAPEAAQRRRVRGVFEIVGEFDGVSVRELGQSMS